MAIHQNQGSYALTKTLATGFTVPEVIVAATILIIICVGVLTVFEQSVRINQGNSVRAQAFTILQKQVEFYRALKYEPVYADPALAGRTSTVVATNVASNVVDGTTFDISVTIDNNPYVNGVQTATSIPAVAEADCKFKEITIEATPHNAQAPWITAIKTKVTIQRVRLVN
jgi:Tfp pilus assembly protein PilV